MRLVFRYELRDGEPSTVTVEPFAIIGYERAHATKIQRLAVDGVGLGDMAELVWRQLSVDGVYSGDLEGFERALVDVGPEDVADPTSPPPVPS
jgi:hypothetical protein